MCFHFIEMMKRSFSFLFLFRWYTMKDYSTVTRKDSRAYWNLILSARFATMISTNLSLFLKSRNLPPFFCFCFWFSPLSRPRSHHLELHSWKRIIGWIRDWSFQKELYYTWRYSWSLQKKLWMEWPEKNAPIWYFKLFKCLYHVCLRKSTKVNLGFVVIICSISITLSIIRYFSYFERI